MSSLGPLVSIVTPAYNAERFIAQTINSVCSQTMKMWEMIVVVDANSRDKTESIVRQFSELDSRIKLVVAGTAGVAENRNKGIAMARANYVCLLDSDDWWHPQKLERQLAFARRTGASFSFTGYECRSADGERKLYSVSVPAKVTYHDLLCSSPIGCLTVMIDKSRHPGFVFRQEDHEDYALWLRMLRDGTNGFGLGETLAFYREVKGSRSNNKSRAALWRWRIYRDQEKNSRFLAAFNFTRYAVASLCRRFCR